MTVAEGQRPGSPGEQRIAELRERGEILVEQLRTLREQTAQVEDNVVVAFERAALYHPDRAAELRFLASQAREVAKQLRESNPRF